MSAQGPSSSGKHLALGTMSFTVCFAVWGLISAFASQFRTQFGLSATQTAFLVAVPVLLGSLARIPMGILADRFGGRLVFAFLMSAVAVPAFLVPQARSFETLLIIAFFLGLAGSSFAVGVSYVSRWYPPEQQGTALGVYGLGNMGQSAAVFLGPLLGKLIGIPGVYQVTAVLVLIWGITFGHWRVMRLPKQLRRGVGATLAILTKERVAWVLSAFYFLTFGGFVAFSIYLPTRCATSLDFQPPMPVSARPGLWCWPPCCVRWVAGFQTRLVGRECFQPSFWALFLLRCCFPGPKCSRLRWAHWDVLP
jgi:NNP family nitrate/nitrite transporter-like MFS transporter